MVTSYRFTIVGNPEPQGNKTGFVNKKTGKVVLVEGKTADARDRFKSWRDAVANEARRCQRETPQGLLEGPIKVFLRFYLTKPKSKPKWKIFPDVRPDTDKLVRAVFDSLTGTIFQDDSQVVELHVYKEYASSDRPPGALVEIDQIDEKEVYASRQFAGVAD